MLKAKRIGDQARPRRIGDHQLPELSQILLSRLDQPQDELKTRSEEVFSETL